MNQTSENIDAIVSEFEDAFGIHSDCTITITPSENFNNKKPEIIITPDGSQVVVIVEIHIRNPFDSNMDSALIVAEATAKVHFSVTKDF